MAHKRGRIRRHTFPCFSFAIRFCDTLRLAHMLYSLARVSRRVQWHWIFQHHSGQSSRRRHTACVRHTRSGGTGRLPLIAELSRHMRKPCCFSTVRRQLSHRDHTGTLHWASFYGETSCTRLLAMISGKTCSILSCGL